MKSKERMDSECLVTIIIPVYNVEKYIRVCLDSVLSQTYRNLEIILVDDGSTDGSGLVCDEYSKTDNRIKVIHKNNEGVSTARNTGIEMATGKYVCFVDSDDILMPDYVEYLYAIVESHNVPVAVTRSFFTTFGGKQIEHDEIELVSGEDAAAQILYYNIPIGCYCKMFSRTFLLSNNIRFIPNVFIGEGFNFNVEAFSHAGKVAIGKRKVYCYRRNNAESAMTKFSLLKSQMAIKAIDIIRSRLAIKTVNLYNACDFAQWHTYGDMLNWIILAGVKMDFPDFYYECRSAVRKYSYRALFAPVNRKEKLRAVLQFINPLLLANLLRLRRWIMIKSK